MLPRPVILGVVGDSAAGKTTLTRGLVRVLGEENVTHVCTDDYHRYDRKQRAELGITPLHPDCNHLDIIAQHLGHLRRGEPILKPVYRHQDGTFGAPVYVKPGALHGDRGPARVLPAGDARGLRRARLPEPTRGPAQALEGAARLHPARLHDRPGACRDRSPRGRFRDVHQAAASIRRHARVVQFDPRQQRGFPARRRTDARTRATPPRSGAVRQ